MPAHRTSVRLALICLAVLRFAPQARAQSGPTGSLSGTTQDANGRRCPRVMQFRAKLKF